MTWNKYRLAEFGGWITGVVGFGFVMFGILVGTGGDAGLQTVIESGGWLVAGFIVALVGGIVAMTSREHRGAGHMAEKLSNEDS